MKNKILKLFFLILLSLTLFSCGKEEECIGDPILFPTPFRFILHNESGDDLISKNILGLNPEEKMSLLDAEGDIVDIDIFQTSSSANISFMYINREEVPNGRITKLFYLRLPDFLGNPNNDIDTLSFVYELISKSYKCNPNAIEFASFQVSYNDSIYNSDLFYQSILFIKK